LFWFNYYPFSCHPSDIIKVWYGVQKLRAYLYIISRQKIKRFAVKSFFKEDDLRGKKTFPGVENCRRFSTAIKFYRVIVANQSAENKDPAGKVALSTPSSACTKKRSFVSVFAEARANKACSSHK
jgi:hypothetical protein